MHNVLPHKYGARSNWLFAGMNLLPNGMETIWQSDVRFEAVSIQPSHPNLSFYVLYGVEINQ